MTLRNLVIILTSTLGSIRCLAGETTLLGGPYPHGWQTTSDVTQIALLAVDAAQLAEKQTIDGKKEIYENGAGGSGLFTLEKMGKENHGFSFPLDFKGSPFYSFYVDTFTEIGLKYENEADGRFDSKRAEDYAGTIVEDLFDLRLPNGIEKEAALIMSAWMTICDLLYEILYRCDREDPNKVANMFNVLDRIAAIWIGIGQDHGANNNGSMLYNIFENAGSRFGQDDIETDVNSKIITDMKQMKAIIENECVNSDDIIGGEGYVKLYRLIHHIMAEFNIPLAQNLIHYMEEEDADYVELYSLSIVPQIRACSPSIFEYFMDTVILNSYDKSKQSDILLHLQTMYSCLGITCNDVGEYSSGLIPECDDYDLESTSLVGYIPKNDVTMYAKVDRDIRQIEILLNRNHIEAAKDIYNFGNNMKAVGKVHDAPVSSLRNLGLLRDFVVVHDSGLPAIFVDYYANDSRYAHAIVEEEFIRFGGPRKGAVTRLFQSMLTPHYALQSFYEAIEICEDDEDPTAAIYRWDVGVAILQGLSVDNISEHDSYTARKVWYNLANEMYLKFDCDDDNKSDKLVMENIQKGKTALSVANCNQAESIVLSIESLLLAPVVQATIDSAVRIEEGIDNEAIAEAVAEGSAFARSIVPMMRPEDAVKITSMMIDMTMTIDSMTVFNAFGHSRTQMGIPCAVIGNHTNAKFLDKNFCDDENFTPPPTNSPSNLPSLQPAIGTKPPTIITEAPTKPALIDPAIIEGRYTFTHSIAEEKAKIALDLKEILAMDSNKGNELKNARNIYENGKNAPEKLKEIGESFPFEMDKDPYYNFYRYALRNDDLFTNYMETDEDLSDIYSEAIVREAFNVAGDIELAYEALVIMTMWMKVIHELRSAVDKCNPITSETQDATLEIDTAVAYYIGTGQSFASSDGNLLYAVAQRAAAVSDTKHEQTKEAFVNADIMERFAEVKVLATSCGLDLNNWLQLRTKVDVIVRTMNIPLIQIFIQHIKQVKEADENSSVNNYVELYGLAILPQIATCNPFMYDFFVREVIDFDLEPGDVDEVLKNLRSVYNCFGLECIEIHGINSSECTETSTVYAGFVPQRPVKHFDRIDQDILKIKALMTEGATDTAKEFYQFGHSTIDGSTANYLSLQELARDPGLEAIASKGGHLLNPQYAAFKEYYKSSYYADDIIMDIFSSPPKDPFTPATSEQRIILVYRALQTMVMYMSGLRYLYSAVEECDKPTPDHPLTQWGKGAALIIGSVEGTERGGDLDYEGVSIYALAKELCALFNTCAGSEDAKTNEDMISFLTSGQSLIAERECSTLPDLLSEGILPTLSVPLIQGTIHFAAINENEVVDKASYASGYILSLATIPLVHESSPTNAQTLKENIRFDAAFKPNASAVLDAFSDSFDGMNVDCKDIGFSTELNLDSCKANNPTIPDPSNGSSLAKGLYVTTTFVEDRAKIDLDVRDMIKFLEEGKRVIAKEIYLNGLHSDIYDSNGFKIGTRSLADFSKNSKIEMIGEPTFNLYRYTLQDGDGKFLGDDVSTYAHNIVMSFFEDSSIFASKNPDGLAAEAAIALNLWAYVVHELHQTVNKCKNEKLTDDDGIHSIDEAAAYWIGYSQQAGDSANGYLLYRLTEESGDMFGQDIDGQTRANRNILRLFKQAAIQLSFPNACSVNNGTYKNLRFVVNKIISQMTIPLIQQLIASLRRNDRSRVKIYSHAVVPLTAGCGQENFSYLKENLILSSYNVVNIDEIIKTLQNVYSCLGIQCKDIGKYQDEAGDKECIDRPEMSPLAGYVPTHDVREISDIDIDIREMEIMMNMKAYDAAKDIYELGKNSVLETANNEEIITLHSLATTSDRSIIPSYKLFNNYFRKEDYANDLIVKALTNGLNPAASPGQLRTIVITALQSMVTYMAALQKMYESIDDCKSSDSLRNVISSRKWDEAAALLTGWLEGVKNGGSGYGHMMFALAKELCADFNICYDNNEYGGDSKVNDNIKILFYTGSSASSLGSCSALLKATEEIEGNLKIPLIQASLHFAVRNRELTVGTEDDGLAAGYVYSRSILPYIKAMDSNAEGVINSNLDFQFLTRPVSDGYLEIFQAFESAIALMPDVECKEIGYMESVSLGLCPGAIGDPRNSSWPRFGGKLTVYVTGFTTCITSFLLYII